jgi:hypothetical protein
MSTDLSVSLLMAAKSFVFNMIRRVASSTSPPEPSHFRCLYAQRNIVEVHCNISKNSLFRLIIQNF